MAIIFERPRSGFTRTEDMVDGWRHFVDFEDHGPTFDIALAKAFNPNQPRDPAGTETGGQWKSTGSSAPAKAKDAHPTAELALGKEGVDKVRELIESRATAAELLDALEPANKLASSYDQTLTEDDRDDQTFFANRVYKDGKNINQTIDDLEATARRYAGPEGPANEGKAMIVIGSPAAGKSTSADELARRGRYAIVDSDDAKKLIPEFRDGIGASAVHEESGVISQVVGGRIYANRTNVIIPRVGDTVGSIQKQIKRLEDAGYSVSVVNVSVNQDEAARRMAGRFLSSGRLINTDYFRSIGNRPNETYVALKKARIPTARINASGPKGSEHVEESTVPGIQAGRPLFG